MSQLVYIENGKTVTDSLTVAETFGKEHRRVMQDIRELGCSAEFRQHNFVPSSYTSEQNKELPKFILTEGGFSFLAMGYTGTEADRFKEMYITEFTRMREELETHRLPTSFTPSQQLQAILMLDGRQQEFEQRIEKIEKNTTIDYGQQNDLRNVGNRRIIQLLGGKESPAYTDKSLRHKAYSALWNEFKDRFNVNSRNNTRIGEFERAAEYVRGWNLPGKLERLVEDQNRQAQMF